MDSDYSSSIPQQNVDHNCGVPVVKLESSSFQTLQIHRQLGLLMFTCGYACLYVLGMFLLSKLGMEINGDKKHGSAELCVYAITL